MGGEECNSYADDFRGTGVRLRSSVCIDADLGGVAIEISSLVEVVELVFPFVMDMPMPCTSAFWVGNVKPCISSSSGVSFWLRFRHSCDSAPISSDVLAAKIVSSFDSRAPDRLLFVALVAIESYAVSLLKSRDSVSENTRPSASELVVGGSEAVIECRGRNGPPLS